MIPSVSAPVATHPGVSGVSVALLCLAALPVAVATYIVATDGLGGDPSTRNFHNLLMLAAPRLALVGLLLCWTLARGGLAWVADDTVARWAIALGGYLVVEVASLACLIWVGDVLSSDPHAVRVAVSAATGFVPLALLALLAVEVFMGGAAGGPPAWLRPVTMGVLGTATAVVLAFGVTACTRGAAMRSRARDAMERENDASRAADQARLAAVIRQRAAALDATPASAPATALIGFVADIEGDESVLQAAVRRLNARPPEEVVEVLRSDDADVLHRAMRYLASPDAPVRAEWAEPARAAIAGYAAAVEREAARHEENAYYAVGGDCELAFAVAQRYAAFEPAGVDLTAAVRALVRGLVEGPVPMHYMDACHAVERKLAAQVITG